MVDLLLHRQRAAEDVEGGVDRTYHAEVPPRVEYAITDLGRSLAPVFAALGTWSDAHLDEVDRARYDVSGRPLPS